ncbi:MAG TPA: hypothetical protein VHC69_18730 [Polyangiaceae bacterium]|nr:hypothetical protein [Polyangiaceae bacterium]
MLLLFGAPLAVSCSSSNSAAPGGSGGFAAMSSAPVGGMSAFAGGTNAGASTGMTSAGGGTPSPIGMGGAGTTGASSGGANASGGSGPVGAGGTGAVASGGAPAAGGHTGECNDVYVDCNHDMTDGCETNTDTDAMNCGACGMACPSAPNATPYCFVGQCHYGCAPGFGDCNEKPDDGCEVNLLSDKDNCGACRLSCGDTECLNGGCKCAGSSVKPKKIPLDMYIVFDESQSMSDNVNGGSKWSVIVGALTSFVQNMGSAGLGVGLTYFPLPLPSGVPGTCGMDSDCKVNGTDYGPCVADASTHLLLVCGKTDSCVATNYKAEVPIDTLPGVAQAIVTSLGMHGPTGFTPTYPALQAGYDYTKTWATNHPDHKTILVLATDGDPTTCDATTNNVQTIAANLVTPANSGPQPILTFVIGVGSSLTSLNAIAQAGGTGQALIVDTGSADPGGDFLAAMKKIGASPLLGCQYSIPAPSMGTTDFTKVNVQLTPDGGTPTVLKKVGNKAGCSPTDGGWYYDNNTTPTQIILCDSTCTAINSGTSVEVDVVLGCASIG